MERSSCRSVLVLRWKVDSVCLEGEAGEFGGLNLAGEGDGVEGPRNDASRLIVTVLDECLCVLLFPKNLKSSFSFNGP